MKRLALSLLLAAVAFVGAFSVLPAPVADAYPPVRPPTIVVPPGVGPGGNFNVTIGNCEAGERVVIIFQGQRRIVICNAGVLSATATFRAPMTPGTYEVCGELTGIGANLPPGTIRPQTLCAQVLVTGVGPTVPPTVPGGGLPATGSSGLSTTATSAIALISAGALLLIVSQVRRRRSAAAPA